MIYPGGVSVRLVPVVPGIRPALRRSLLPRLCLEGTPAGRVTGHLMQIRASLPGNGETDLCNFNSLSLYIENSRETLAYRAN
jgi:hypothetical protein